MTEIDAAPVLLAMIFTVFVLMLVLEREHLEHRIE